MDLKKWKGFLLDVDGTLYSQKKMRVKMLLRLVIFYAFRPHRLRELYVLILFRKLREMNEWKQASFDNLYQEINRRTELPANRIENTIQYWMFQAPLDVIKECSYQDVISFVNKQHQNGKKIIVYSDYPAMNKLIALGMEYDSVYSFGTDGINEQKPSSQIMETIITKSGYSVKQLLYVGDRDDRDKASAELVNMAYCDIRQFKRLIASWKISRSNWHH